MTLNYSHIFSYSTGHTEKDIQPIYIYILYDPLLVDYEFSIYLQIHSNKAQTNS